MHGLDEVPEGQNPHLREDHHHGRGHVDRREDLSGQINRSQGAVLLAVSAAHILGRLALAGGALEESALSGALDALVLGGACAVGARLVAV